MKLFILLLIFLVTYVLTEKARYDKYRVYKILIEDRNQLDALKFLADTSDSVIKKIMKSDKIQQLR